MTIETKLEHKMMLKISSLLTLLCLYITLATTSKLSDNEKKKPNVIIMHFDNLVNEHVIHEKKMLKKFSNVQKLFAALE